MKLCPKCDKKMIKIDKGIIYPTYPPQILMQWWCECGYAEDTGVIRGKTVEEINHEE